mgnify:CR=1 FL=1
MCCCTPTQHCPQRLALPRLAPSPTCPPAPAPLQCRDPRAALEVFEQMKAAGLRPDVVAYTSVLTALQGSPQVRCHACLRLGGFLLHLQLLQHVRRRLERCGESLAGCTPVVHLLYTCCTPVPAHRFFRVAPRRRLPRRGGCGVTCRQMGCSQTGWPLRRSWRFCFLRGRLMKRCRWAAEQGLGRRWPGAPWHVSVLENAHRICCPACVIYACVCGARLAKPFRT